MSLDRLIHEKRVNAIIGWILTGTVALGAIQSVLTGEILWGVFSVFVVVVVSLPGLTTRNWTAIVSWSLLSVVAVAVLARVIEFYAEIAGYLAIAALALIVVVELDVFTSVKLSRRFAIVFAVLTTMALQAVWIVAQFYSDQWLKTEFLSTQTELQKDIVTVTIVGFVLGGLFQWYFARFEPIGSVDGSSKHEETT
ncbi:hypothetical protein [Haloprofundus halobius]|uniref:hypothetical protein n=1 Tax=Haloprofundus halobius TaxID=2876194 RepID=UPI001CCD15B1|nr:hypothetical protein [Haloprofundus halobius]